MRGSHQSEENMTLEQALAIVRDIYAQEDYLISMKEAKEALGILAAEVKKQQENQKNG